MDREANYVTVGIFVLLVLLLGAGFVLWYSDTADGKASKRYEIYFDGSVGGLSDGSTVRYLGVVVGRVSRIGIDPRNSSRVRVVADIEEDAPVKADTVARLSLQGVTGLLYINLQPREAGAGPPRLVPSLKFPVIPSAQSQFDVLIASLPDVVAKAGEALNRINALLSDQNIAAVSATIGNTERATAAIPAAVADARTTFHELEEAATEMQTAMSSLGELGGDSGENIKAAAAKLRAAADSVAKSAARLDRMVGDNAENIDRFAGDGLAEFEQLMRETREAMQSFDALTKSLEKDPSRVIYRPAPAGVEIPP
ncbi:MAG TPA: MlaD family protein [Steroidobacteraceae bacterium]|jgi:phospholipid/cholesterol/gamma-HCH transport system substrate-binding protein|nr:MlaD family protein [Steroidobacteraceae bacterium]